MHFRYFHHDEHGGQCRPEERGRGAHDGFGREGRFGRHWRGGYEPREGRLFDSGDLPRKIKVDVEFSRKFDGATNPAA